MIGPVKAKVNAWAEAPGKVIITGEHAVVYGQPALAAAINRLSRAQVTWGAASASSLPVMTLLMPQVGLQRTVSVSDLQQLAQRTSQKHQDYLAGQGPLANVFALPEDLLLAALGYCVTANSLPISQSFTINLHTDLLLGSGMGSSASLVAVLMAALLTACGGQFNQQQLISQVLVAEQWQHGHASGVDPQVCILGGIQSFQHGTSHHLTVAQQDGLFLVTTGQSESSTGECVVWVRQQHFPDGLWQQFGDLEQCFEESLQTGDAKALTAHIKANHQLLLQLGVVPVEVAQFVQSIEHIGGAAKICGAGSIRGDQGGLVLAQGITGSALQMLCDGHGYDYRPLVRQQQGVTYGSQ